MTYDKVYLVVTGYSRLLNGSWTSYDTTYFRAGAVNNSNEAVCLRIRIPDVERNFAITKCEYLNVSFPVIHNSDYKPKGTIYCKLFDSDPTSNSKLTAKELFNCSVSNTGMIGKYSVAFNFDGKSNGIYNSPNCKIPIPDSKDIERFTDYYVVIYAGNFSGTGKNSTLPVGSFIDVELNNSMYNISVEYPYLVNISFKVRGHYKNSGKNVSYSFANVRNMPSNYEFLCMQNPLTLPSAPSCDGFKFTGWEVDGSSKLYPASSNYDKDLLRDITFYATFYTPNNLTVVYKHGEDDECPVLNSSGTYVNYNGEYGLWDPASVRKEIPEFVRPGYHHWASKAWRNRIGSNILSAETAFTPSQIAEKLGESGNTNLKAKDCTVYAYAYWQPDTYKVALNHNEGTCSIDCYYYQYEQSQVDANKESFWYFKDKTLTMPLYPKAIILPVRPGYIFKGYKYSKDGKLYINEYGIKQNNLYKIRPASGDTITLDAQWDKNWYNLSFDLYGGEVIGKPEASLTMRVEHDNPIAELPIPTKEGHEFEGWYYENKKYESGSVYDLSHDATFVAKWAPLIKTYKYDGNVWKEVRLYYYNKDKVKWRELTPIRPKVPKKAKRTRKTKTT